MGTPFEPTQEVRLAVVLYGGVSLAIYMNGVTQELYHLVRATAPAEPISAEPASARPGGDLRSTEPVYRQLGQMLHHGGAPVISPLAPGPDDPVRTRFVVDILSGSSAGGINGIFLAKALANDQPLDQLKRLWVEEGDIARLLNDRASLAGTPGLRLPEPPSRCSTAAGCTTSCSGAWTAWTTTNRPARSRRSSKSSTWPSPPPTCVASTCPSNYSTRWSTSRATGTSSVLRTARLPPAGRIATTSPTPRTRC
jgi:patatin-related protein